mmetsp:Transcript_98149/g.154699  ORF Transcript_98149/g.154699 Transcript_98149/m.154699 type:complete len:346 (-) Transcript_98149:175-1212(-)
MSCRSSCDISLEASIFKLREQLPKSSPNAARQTNKICKTKSTSDAPAASIALDICHARRCRLIRPGISANLVPTPLAGQVLLKLPTATDSAARLAASTKYWHLSLNLSDTASRATSRSPFATSLRQVSNCPLSPISATRASISVLMAIALSKSSLAAASFFLVSASANLCTLVPRAWHCWASWKSPNATKPSAKCRCSSSIGPQSSSSTTSCCADAGGNPWVTLGGGCSEVPPTGAAELTAGEIDAPWERGGADENWKSSSSPKAPQESSATTGIPEVMAAPGASTSSNANVEGDGTLSDSGWLSVTALLSSSKPKSANDSCGTSSGATFSSSAKPKSAKASFTA